VDSKGYPIYDDNVAQFIPRPGDPVLINPGPGCFGLGPGMSVISSGRNYETVNYKFVNFRLMAFSATKSMHSFEISQINYLP
jgi:hypothetical protein